MVAIDNNNIKSCVKKIKRYEKRFTVNHGKGMGKNIVVYNGNSDCTIVAPYAVRMSNTTDSVCQYTGAITKFLAKATGCKAILFQKTPSDKNKDVVIGTFQKTIEGCNSNIILEIQAYSTEESTIMKVGGFKSATNKVLFGAKLCKFTTEYFFKEDCIFGNKFVEIVENSTSKKWYENGIESNVLAIKINTYFIDHNPGYFQTLISSLCHVVSCLLKVDWNANIIDVFRVWQASSHMPQDKIEIVDSKNDKFKVNDFIHIATIYGEQETARVRKISDKSIKEIEKFEQEEKISRKEGTYEGEIILGEIKDYIFLTNRLLENLYGREWYEGEEEYPGLRGAPVIAYQNLEEKYNIGTPKATQVDMISLSEELFIEKMPLSNKYDYLVFNRYTDARIYIDIEKSNYHDHGRVKDSVGNPAKKVMIPRYYRLMLGFEDKPLQTIREEEYWKILDKLEIEIESSDSVKQEDFIRCYQKISGQPYMRLVEENEVVFDEEKELYRKSICKIKEYFEQNLKVYQYVNLIRVPKKNKQNRRLFGRMKELVEKFELRLFKLLIDKSEYILKTVWAGDTDDKNEVARLNSNMMSLLGISENDKILVKFGSNKTILRVLPKEELTDYEIGIPSSGRRKLGMNNMNDIVIVHRDMKHTFRRHSQEQTIAILGTVLAVAQALTAFSVFTTKIWGIVVAIIVCVLAIVFMLYFALGEERVKVRKAKEKSK